MAVSIFVDALMLLVIGVMVGCWNAWYWVKKQSEQE
jgi:hypothetical protein